MATCVRKVFVSNWGTVKILKKSNSFCEYEMCSHFSQTKKSTQIFLLFELNYGKELQAGADIEFMFQSMSVDVIELHHFRKWSSRHQGDLILGF